MCGLLPPFALLSLPMARPPADAVVCDDCAWLPPDRLILLRKPPFFFGWSAAHLSSRLVASSFLSAFPSRTAAGETLRPGVNGRDLGSGLASKVMLSL